MAVMRVHKTGNYTVMSNYHFKEKDMSLKAKGLLSLMLSLPDTWDYTIAGLISLSKDNETAVKSALKELKEFKYLVMTKKMPHETESGRIEYTYDIYEKPYEQVQNSQDVENLYIENQRIESQYIENPGLLNTNVLNTNVLNTNNKILSKDIKAEQALAGDKSPKSLLGNSKKTSSTKTQTYLEKNKLYREMIDSFSTENKIIRGALNKYLEVRKSKGLTPAQWKVILEKLKEQNLSEDEIVKAVDYSILRNYMSIYAEPKKREYRSNLYEDNLKGKKQSSYKNLSDDEKENYFSE